ncbi:unnamed protein product, partial [Prorocentrum cordatum]
GAFACEQKFEGQTSSMKVFEDVGRKVWGERRRAVARETRRRPALQKDSQKQVEEAQASSKRYDQGSVKERRQKWSDKQEAAASGAAGGLHGLSKTVEIWRPRRAATAQASADPFQAAEAAPGEWKHAWRVGDPLPQARRPRGCEACMELGGFQMADLDWLKRLLDIRREMERALAWPKNAATVVLFLIPKSANADRVTGLLPTLVRVWEIMRVDPAVMATMPAILDLVKALERVSLHGLWERGKHMKFHTGVLAVVCSYFAMARRVVAGGSASTETCTVATTFAGSKFSVGFLRKVIQRGAQQWVADVFPDIVDESMVGFAGLGLEFSAGEQDSDAVVAGAKWLREAAIAVMGERGLLVERARPHPGVGMVAAGAVAAAKSGKLFSKMRKCTASLLHLRRGGRAMSGGPGLGGKCAPKRSVLHGCKCLGTPDHQLQLLRRAAGEILPGSRGAKGLTVQLALAKEEPTFEAAE